MTISKLVYVTCDYCGNPCGGGEDMCDSARKARRVARTYGWQRLRSIDVNLPIPTHRVSMVDICYSCQKMEAP